MTTTFDVRVLGADDVEPMRALLAVYGDAFEDEATKLKRYGIR